MNEIISEGTGRQLRFTDDFKQKVIQLRLSRYSHESIACHFGVALKTIHGIIYNLRKKGRLPHKRIYAADAKRPQRQNQEYTENDDFAFAVYQYAATHTGCTDDEIAAATGYSLSRVSAETVRLSKGLGRLLQRDGNGWRQAIDGRVVGAMRGADARAINLLKEAA